MLFRGSYEVTRQLKGVDIVSTNQATLKNVNVAGSLSVAASQTINFNANKLTNVGLPVANNDATNKVYVDGIISHAYTGTAAPLPALGKNEDTYFQGTLGGKRELTGITEVTHSDVASDGTTIIVAVDGYYAKFYKSIDNGVSWTMGDALSTDTSNRYKSIRSPNIGKFFMAREKIGTGATPSAYTIDSGVTWLPSSYPAIAQKTIKAVFLDKDNANENMVMTVVDGIPTYSADGGATWLQSNAPSGTYAVGTMFSSTVLIVNAAGVCYKSLDYGKTYTVQGSLPAISIEWTKMFSPDGNIYVCAGIGADSNKFAFSYNTGLTWTEKVVSATPLQVIDLSVNRITGVVAAAGSNNFVSYSHINNVEEWTRGTINDTQYLFSDMDTHGSGFIGVNNNALPVVVMTVDGKAWSTDVTAGFSKLYNKTNNQWVPLDLLQTTSNDVRYLRTSGGIVNGNLGLNNHTISGLLDPINKQDAATKSYVDEQMALSGGASATIPVGTVLTLLDTVAADVDMIKYQISAKVGTKRYFSEVTIIANGVDVPQFIEHAVMKLGDLNVTITVAKDGTGKTLVRAITSEVGSIVYYKRVDIKY